MIRAAARVVGLAAACAVALPATAAAIPAPRVGEAGYHRLQRVLPHRYRPGDATVAIAAAAPFGVRRVNRGHLYPISAGTSLQSFADWLARWA